jgi:GTP-binding protein YchF
MGFHCGIVGLPNVGKSTLFNALTSTFSAQAANYPFCTIEPNIGRVPLEDPRLIKLASVEKSQKIIFAQMEFVDIAGLVKGASQGQGLGNQFLSHIKQTDAIIHMVRCFDDEDIIHVDGSVDPLRDIDVIETELLLSDLISIEKKVTALQKKAKNDKVAAQELAVFEPVLKLLEQGLSPLSFYKTCDETSQKIIDHMQLISMKKVCYVANVTEEDVVSGNIYTQKVIDLAISRDAPSVIICAKIEEELAELDSNDKQDYLNNLGLRETGLNRIGTIGYDLLNLMSFFTVGPKEARAWTIQKGSKAPQAAGAIHTDFEKGFICAQTISYDDYIEYQGEEGTKSAGKMRLEGRDYTVQDGDVIHFRFNV